MKGTVTKLYDIDRIVIPEELLDLHVEDCVVDDKVQLLSIRYAKESDADVVMKGDTVYCKADEASYPDHRSVILFTASNLPNAQEANEQVIGKAVNETVSTTLAKKDVTLTIQKIIRRTPVEINDALIDNLQIDGVKTVEEYREYLKNQMRQDMIMERHKAIFYHFMTELRTHSEFVYDQKEMDDYIQQMIAQYPPEALGDMDPKEVEESVACQVKEGWVADAFCTCHNIEIDPKEVEETVAQMMEMQALMGEEVPSKEEMTEMYLQNAKFNAFYEFVDTIATEKLGG